MHFSRKSFWLQAVFAAYALYLVLPMALILIGSVGKSWTNTLFPTGFTWGWFIEISEDGSFQRSFWTSLKVAACTCVAVAIIALPLAYSLYHRALAGGGFVARLMMAMPVAVPALTLGFGYVLVFSSDVTPWLGSLPLLIAAHVILTLPYMVQTLLFDLRHLNLATLELSAATLGAPPWKQFATIVLPNLRQSVLSGAIMVVALSIGEFQVSNLIASFQHRTYPIVLLQAFYGATGMACAATVVLLGLATISTLTSAFLVRSR